MKTQTQFNIGDRVEWSSQAGGHETVKVGTIVAHVPAGSLPVESYHIHQPGFCRRTPSYIVEIDRPATMARGTKRVNGNFYWPLPSRLQLVSAASPTLDDSAAAPATHEQEPACCGAGV